MWPLGGAREQNCSNLCSPLFQYMLAPFQFALGLVPTYARLGSNLCSDESSVTCDSGENQNLFQLDLGSCKTFTAIMTEKKGHLAVRNKNQ